MSEMKPGTVKVDKAVQELADKARRFCAFQERCSSETKRKIKSMGANPLQTEFIITLLQDEGYLNDERFARAYAHGKFSNNRWGLNKIRHELISRNIDEAIISSALQEIDETTYREELQKLIEKKCNELKSRGVKNMKEKLVAFCVQKGYEYDLIRQIAGKL